MSNSNYETHINKCDLLKKSQSLGQKDIDDQCHQKQSNNNIRKDLNLPSWYKNRKQQVQQAQNAIVTIFSPPQDNKRKFESSNHQRYYCDDEHQEKKQRRSRNQRKIEPSKDDSIQNCQLNKENLKNREYPKQYTIQTLRIIEEKAAIVLQRQFRSKKSVLTNNSKDDNKNQALSQFIEGLPKDKCFIQSQQMAKIFMRYYNKQN